LKLAVVIGFVASIAFGYADAGTALGAKYSALDLAMPAARSGSTLPAVDLFKTVSPSIYLIVAAKDEKTLKQLKSVYEGSAVAISSTLALTNCHIVARRKTILLVQKKDGDTARVVASDPKTDRCIVETARLKMHPVQGVRRFGDLHVGEKVYTIGNPSGLEATLGEGLVSGLRERDGVRYVQTSAPISPGSSGGGLFDERGNLLGITAFKLVNAENLNFAIAAEDYWAKIETARKRPSKEAAQ
jgi:S1-C subfamily serine protease